MKDNNKIFTAQVESIAAGGAGIARINGKTVFVEMTAPGDKIRFKIQKEHKNWAEGELVDILEPSSKRVAPVCLHYGRCGGCSLQHLSYDAQLEAKTAILRDACLRIGRFEPPAIRVRSSAPFEYRNRVQLHRTECNRLGFMERKSRRVIALNDCPVADTGIRHALKNGTLCVPNRTRFNVYSLGGTFLWEGGTERGRVKILGREIEIDASVFFQSNATMLELLIGDLLNAASSADKSFKLKSFVMADIYCGVGTFASFLAQEFSGTDLVEENKKALDLARKNIKAKNVNYHALTDAAWVKALSNTKKNPWGFMILDPPREGLSRPFCDWLSKTGPPLVAYVSCNPAAFARDSAYLLQAYTLKELTFYDFYPQTAHIESLALFYRAM